MRMPLPRPLARLLARVLEPILVRLPVDDPWERLPVAVPPWAFGRGSVRDFRWYFEGESLVEAESLEAICDWLAGCEYVPDPELFHEPDFWQHPRTFERLRKGDCEDHALWAWRKLVELGYDAELVCGEWDVTRDDAGGHAWVVFRDDGREYLFEAVARSTADMIRPLDEVRARYCPHVAVDRHFRTAGFSGHTASLQRRRARRRALEGAPTAKRDDRDPRAFART
jgi:hypothetical protein